MLLLSDLSTSHIKYAFFERFPTKGADFYSSILPNPQYIKPVEDADDAESKDTNTTSTKKKKKKKSKKKSKKTKSSRGKNDDGAVATATIPDLIDTGDNVNRGLDSLLVDDHSHKRKKRHKHSKKKDRASATTRASADIHIDWQQDQESDLEYDYDVLRRHTVALQMWDTAGKERLVSQSTGQLTSRLGDAFFRHANVAILMYDATSSRSFLQLIKWYSELLERIHRLQVVENDNDHGEKSGHGFGYGYGYGNANANSTNNYYGKNSNGNSRPEKQIQMRFPVLVVASKLDVVMAKEASRLAQKKEVPQRHVMGLESFRGMNYHYEYGDANDGRIKYGSNHGHGHGRGGRSGQEKKKHDSLRSTSSTAAAATNEDRMSQLSYGLESHSWAHDKSYLQYIRIAEDACYPDREMVLRWCRRNGLQHVEVSALENIGVDVAVKSAVNLALDQMKEEEKIEMERKREFAAKVNAMNSHHRHSSDHSSLKTNSLGYQQRHLQNDECIFCPWLVRIIRNVPIFR